MHNNNYQKSLLPWFWAVGVGVLGLLVSTLLVRQQSASIHRIEQLRLAQAADSLTEALVRRLDVYTEIAFGLRGLFVVNPRLGRAEFMQTVAQLDVENRHPGLKNIAFTRYVTAAQKSGFEASVRADTSVDPQGYPGFAIHPPGERSSYFVADYLWPMQGNKGVHGLDISAQPANLASMQYSRKSGLPVASGPFDLLQESSHRAGFVVRVPVFHGGPAALNKPAEEQDFLGSVAVTLRVFDVFEQLSREGRLQGLQLQLVDHGSSIDPSPTPKITPMFSSSERAVAGADHSDRHYHRDLVVYGRQWLLDFQPGESLLSDSERRAPVLAGFAGGVISLLISALVLLSVRGWLRVQERAQRSGEALKDSEERWKFAVEGARDGLWDWDVAHSTVFFSSRWKEMLGFADAEVGNLLEEWRKRVHPDDLPQVMANIQAHMAGTTASYVSEHRVSCKDGSWKWILDRGRVVARDANGAALRMIGTHTDISERKDTERKLQSSLQEKNALLREVHHRVKNNLQVISSLLRMEGRRSDVPAAKSVLLDMQGRIRSMALLHESLYRSGTFASVDLSVYLADLARQVFKTQLTHTGAVRLKLNMAAVAVSMDQAIPLGLLVNELLSNSLKHGFPSGHSGELLASLQPAQVSGFWCLCVSDTGVGLPVDFEVRKTSSLGLQLVTDLSRQLGGELQVAPASAGAGAKFTVLFAVVPLEPNYPQRA